MTHTEASTILRAFLARIDRFEVEAIDPQAKQQIEQFLNGYDPTRRRDEIEGSGALDALAELPTDSSEQDLLVVIEPQVTLWAVNYLDPDLYAKLQVVRVYFTPHRGGNNGRKGA